MDDVSSGEVTAPGADAEAEFNPVYHHYGPHRAGLPKLLPYARELWNRRAFATETSKAEMRSANSMTVFGQLWLILNPLLLAGVYFVLVTIIRRGSEDPASRFTHLTCGLFAFTYFQACCSSGAKSVTGSGKLLLNTAFPRLLIPLAAVRTAFFRFLPTVPVYLVFHLVFGRSWSPVMLLSVVFLAMITLFGMGLAALFATLQVYFRDTSSFLPYFLRLWLYLSPVLWYPKDLEAMHPLLQTVAKLNPMYSMVGGYSDLLHSGHVPPPAMWITGAACAIVAAIIGFVYFMSREREFSVRIV